MKNRVFSFQLFLCNKTTEMISSPSYIIDLQKLERNLLVLQELKQSADCRVVLALKAFSLWHTFPLIRKHLDGCCASGLWEAELSHQHMQKHTLTYAPAYKEEDILRLLEISTHIDFNSISQWELHRDTVMQHPRFLSGDLLCGLRINPEHSTGKTQKYDPCSPQSRLGATAESLKNADLTGISGLHFHTLCEQYTDDLESTLQTIDQKFGPLLHSASITWLNIGGGHWITQADYDREHLISLIKQTKSKYALDTLWIEPGEAVVLGTGVLEFTVIDILKNGDHEIAIIDVSATAHMPDTIEMPYKAEIKDLNGIIASQESGLNKETSYTHTYHIGGPTCLAGDTFGAYSFPYKLTIGQRLQFTDTAHYTMVKTTTFNGVKHPALVLKKQDGSLDTVREFSYTDFESKLG